MMRSAMAFFYIVGAALLQFVVGIIALFAFGFDVTRFAVSAIASSISRTLQRVSPAQ